MPEKSDDIKSLFAHLGLNPNDYQELRGPAPAAPARPAPVATPPPGPPPAATSAGTTSPRSGEPQTRSWNLIEAATRSPSRVAQLPPGATRSANAAAMALTRPAPLPDEMETREQSAVAERAPRAVPPPPPRPAPDLGLTRVARSPPPSSPPRSLLPAPVPAASPAPAPAPPIPPAGSGPLAQAFHRLAAPDAPARGGDGRLRLRLGVPGRPVAALRDENLQDVFSRLARLPRK